MPAHHGSTSPRIASTQRNHASRSVSTDFCNRIRHKRPFHDRPFSTHSQSSCHIVKVVPALRHQGRKIASDAPPCHTSRDSLYGAFFVKEFAERQIFCLSSVSLFDLKARFFVPTRGSLTSSRAGAVKVGRRANLAACSELARPYLDSFEHDGTLGAIGMTIRGEPAFGRGSVAPQPCIRWVQGPEP